MQQIKDIFPLKIPSPHTYIYIIVKYEPPTRYSLYKANVNLWQIEVKIEVECRELYLSFFDSFCDFLVVIADCSS